ncbi:MAG: signal peptidase I [Candidatus Wildermuthbacteria bacterium RIFCSPHIGHO2_12_FULL_45_9]|uniref:Signal peptidase I n=1 Tax=Candidatus Wildermuthbacteria bacterium RIFCSPHIGHO2_02_FULL_45_25 TaxID=1802450 RepID=A0A1G2R167_9BACT|nr:MAG: signal peptidase I [Candidatus Wildermuthbacteria bacterium RIFCSPHIGHO2_01_FULL_45_20]OHA66570.1 MAG: signal peptidase I [Candidatus Wildermuthbacteria bacterium RIFCSPHIGHO2_02_FULL_45_25]OHA70715.1 MAG: signal peptidase I [Candidatus Wildermuthbacteria bacterium RIFCSPHIGHO2_12_FULL_45_9]
MKNTFTFIWEVGKILLIAFALVIALRLFVFQPFLVRGSSMEPNFHNLDYLVVDEISYRFHEPKRGDVIVFKYPNEPSQKYIKRIIGLPGETVQIGDGKIFISKEGKTMNPEESYLEMRQTSGSVKETLGENEYFVMGDNRAHSADSRQWGDLPKENIIGKVFLRVFPLGDFGAIKTPIY